MLAWACRARPGRRVRVRSLGLDLIGLGEPELADGEAFPLEQVYHLGQRQADDIGVGADHLHHEGTGDALDRIAASLAPPFTAR